MSGPDEPTPIAERQLQFPPDMAVAPVQFSWALNNDAEGRVWLWTRTVASCDARAFSIAEAEHLYRALGESIARGRDIAERRDAT